jgi:hypothetical protein
MSAQPESQYQHVPEELAQNLEQVGDRPYNPDLGISGTFTHRGDSYEFEGALQTVKIDGEEIVYGELVEQDGRTEMEKELFGDDPENETYTTVVVGKRNEGSLNLQKVPAAGLDNSNPKAVEWELRTESDEVTGEYAGVHKPMDGEFTETQKEVLDEFSEGNYTSGEVEAEITDSAPNLDQLGEKLVE